MKRVTALFFVVLAGIASFATVVQADYIRPASATVTGTGITATGNAAYLFNNAVDTTFVQIDPTGGAVGERWVATVAATTPPAQDEVFLTVDLGKKYDVTQMHVWRFNSDTGKKTSVNEYSLLGSTDGVTFNTIYVAAAPKLGLSALVSEPVQTVNFASQAGVNLNNALGIRYVQMDIKASYSGWLGQYGATTVGLGELGFGGTATATPEPSTLVLLGSVLIGLLAYAWRKRK